MADTHKDDIPALSLIPCAYQDQTDSEANNHIFRAIKRSLAARLGCFSGKRPDHLLRHLQYCLDVKLDIASDDLKEIIELLVPLLFSETQTSLRIKLCGILERLLKLAAKSGVALRLDWRAFADLVEGTHFHKGRLTPLDLGHVHGQALMSLIKAARRFWAPGATQEILDQYLPLCCVHDQYTFKAQGYLCHFLPTKGPAADVAAWHETLLKLWDWFPECNEAAHLWAALFSRTAHAQAVDWDTHLRAVFLKFHRMMGLPLSSEAIHRIPSVSFPAGCSVFVVENRQVQNGVTMMCLAKWAVWMLGEQYSAADAFPHLRALIRMTEPYFHPSNTGGWTPTLSQFLLSLTELFAKRLVRERAHPESLAPRLTDSDVRAFVECLRPVLWQALFAKSPAMVASATITWRNLIQIAPAIVVPWYFERLAPALETTLEAHQTISAIGTLSTVAPTLIAARTRAFMAAHNGNGDELTSPGVIDLVLLLSQTLYGLDSNDPTKTVATAAFYTMFLSSCSLFDACACCQSATRAEESEGEAQLREATAFFPDWVIQLVDRLFFLFENRPAPERGQMEERLQPTLFEMITFLCQRLDDALLQQVTAKTVQFIEAHVLTNAIAEVAHLCSELSRAAPEAFLRMLLGVWEHLDLFNDFAHAPTRTLEWHLRLLASSLLYAGSSAFPFLTQITRVIELALQHAEHKVIKLGAEILRQLLMGLISPYVRDWRSVPPSMWNDPEYRATHYRTWGLIFGKEPRSFRSLRAARASVRAAPVPRDPSKVVPTPEPDPHPLDTGDVWHIPTLPELRCAADLEQRFVYPALDWLARLCDRRNGTTNEPEPAPETEPDRPALEGIARFFPPIDGDKALSKTAERRGMLAALATLLGFGKGTACVTMPLHLAYAAPCGDGSMRYSCPTPLVIAAGAPDAPGRFAEPGLHEECTLDAAHPGRLRIVVPLPNRAAWARVLHRVAALVRPPPPPAPEAVSPPSPQQTCEAPSTQDVPSSPRPTDTTAPLVDLAPPGPSAHPAASPLPSPSPSPLPSSSPAPDRSESEADASGLGDDVESLCMLSRCFSLVLTEHAFENAASGTQLYLQWKCIHHDRISKFHLTRPRMLRRWQIRARHAYSYRRFVQRHAAPLVELNHAAAADLVVLASSPYPRLRRTARRSLLNVVGDRRYLRAVAEQATALLGSPETTEESMLGVTQLIGAKAVARYIGQHWATLEAFAAALRNTDRYEKHAVQQQTQNAVHQVFQGIRTVPAHIPAPCIAESPHRDLIIRAWDGPPDPALLDARARSAAAKTQRNREAHDRLVEALVRIANDPAAHWRSQANSITVLNLISASAVPRDAPALARTYLHAIASDTPSIRALGSKTFSVLAAFFKQRVPRDHLTRTGPTPAALFAEAPDTAEAWAATHWSDLNHAGWSGRPHEAKVYRAEEPPEAPALLDRPPWQRVIARWRLKLSAPRDTPHLPPDLFRPGPAQSSAVREAVLSVFADEAYRVRLAHIASTIQRSKFLVHYQTLYKSLFQCGGLALLELLLPQLRSLAAKPEDKNAQGALAEMVSGALRGSKHWPHAALTRMRAALAPVIMTSLAHINHESQALWEYAFNHAASDLDPRRFYWLTDLLVSYLMPEDSAFPATPLTTELAALADDPRAVKHRLSSPQGQTRVLAALVPFFTQASWRGTRFFETMARRFTATFNSDVSPLVRRYIAHDTALLVAGATEFPATEGRLDLAQTDRPHALPATLALAQSLVHAYRASRIALDRAAQESEGEFASLPESKAHASVCKCLFSFSRSMLCGTTLFLQPLFEELLIVFFDALLSSDQDLSAAAKALLSSVASHPMPPHTLSAVCALLLQLHGAAEANKAPYTLLDTPDASDDAALPAPLVPLWHFRVGLVHFLEVLATCHAFCAVSRELFDLCRSYLADPQAEVRDRASTAVSALVRSQPPDAIEPLIAQYTQWLRTKHSGSMSSPETAARHGGALGLSALVQAFPHSVPPWLPGALAELGRHVNAPNPIQSTIRKAFSSFWKTHQDAWPLHKEHFTPDQLDLLQGMTVAPSYYI